MQIVSLKLNKEFKRAYYQGKFKAHPYLVTYMVRNRTSGNRVGITTSKKVGNAVQRNRARRIIREAYRILAQEQCLPQGFDFVFTARADTPAKKTTDLIPVMKRQITFLMKQRDKKMTQRSGRKRT